MEGWALRKRTALKFFSSPWVRRCCRLRPDRLYLFFPDRVPLELKISSAEERDVWYEAISAIKKPAFRLNRGWGDLGSIITRRNSQEKEEQEEQEDLVATPVPYAEEPASPFFLTAAAAATAVAAALEPKLEPVGDLPFEHKLSDARTSNLSINRDALESSKRKPNFQLQQPESQPFRQVVVPILLHASDIDPPVGEEAFQKTSKQIQLLSQVIESEFPTSQDDDSEVVKAIVNSMFKVTLPDKDTVIAVQGEPADRMLVVESGEVGVYSQDFAHRPAELEHCKHEGGCFGVHNVLYHQPAPFTIRTHQPASVFWVLTRGKYLELITQEQKRLVAKKAKALERIWLLQRYLELSLLDQVAEAMEIERYRESQLLAKAGDSVSKLFVVVEGRLRFGTLLLQRNDVFGESALVTIEGKLEFDLVCESTTCEVISLAPAQVEAICGPVKLYIIKKFTSALLLEVEDFDLEFERIVTRDRAPILTLASTTTQNVVRMSTMNDEDHAQSLFPEDLTFDRTGVQSLRPDLHLENLKLVGQLGKGQFGVVHRAMHVDTGEGFALKVLKGQVITLNGWESMVEQERDTMLELTHTLRSPFLLQLLHHFGDFKNCYLVIELCLGGNLYELVKNKNMRFTAEHIQYYIASTVLALDHMHSVNIIHRDVKPENSMLTLQGRVKLADFGISKKALRTFSFCGTPDYMAPEMLTNRGYGSGVDFWATGIMLFELVSGYAPFSDFEASEIYEKTLQYADTHALQFPKTDELGLLTAECQRLILDLLHPTKTKRLGIKYPGVLGVKTHEFFKGFDWEALGSGKMQPPLHVLPDKPTPAPDNTYDAQLYFSPDDITGWTLRF
ncbi:hypothetical protein BASA82_001114 [Batrachochytrium salamandrivorans]|nr:hypothetical protein BASA82_001114 [Batrachochytrium salamandrivorans]